MIGSGTSQQEKHRTLFWVLSFMTRFVSALQFLALTQNLARISTETIGLVTTNFRKDDPALI